MRRSFIQPLEVAADSLTQLNMLGAVRREQQLLILLLSVVAAVRVFIFSAAFPFFSNIDEDLHFDLITQY